MSEDEAGEEVTPNLPEAGFVEQPGSDQAGVLGDAEVEELREYLARASPFGDLLTVATVRSFRDRGLLEELEPFEIPLIRMGVDELCFPCELVRPAIDDIAGIVDLEARAFAIIENHIYGVGEREQALIFSVRDSLPFGWAAQANLVPPQKERKVYPWWYRPYRQPQSEMQLANLFEDFGIEVAGEESKSQDAGPPAASLDGATTKDET